MMTRNDRILFATVLAVGCSLCPGRESHAESIRIRAARVCYGDARIMERARASMNEVTPTAEIVEYLLSRSTDCMKNAMSSFKQMDASHWKRRLTASGILYAIGYWALATAYQKCKSPPLTVDQAIQAQPEHVQSLWQRGLRLKKNESRSGDVRSYLKAVQAWSFGA
jgi:hypothetical protein